MNSSDETVNIINLLLQIPRRELFHILDIYKEEREKQNISKTVSDGEDVPPSDNTFQIYSIPDDIKKELEICVKSRLNNDKSRALWADVLERLPKRTLPMCRADEKFIKDAERIWKKNIFGLETVFEQLLTHFIQYLRCGRSRPVLLVGSPGTGKSKIIRTVAEILHIPAHFGNAPQMAKGNGLTGISRSFMGAFYGECIEGMVRAKQGNFVFGIDEIDKAQFYQGRSGEFQTELLQLLEQETAKEFKDNFIGFSIDASHVFVMMTANGLEPVIEPLKSRCDIITLPSPSKSDIVEILISHTIPAQLKSMQCENLTVRREDIVDMVDYLYDKSEVKDIRQFQSFVERSINGAVLKSISTNSPVALTSDDLKNVCKERVSGANHHIGFI